MNREKKKEKLTAKKLRITMKAKTLRDVFLEMKKVDIKEAYRRFNPHHKNSSVQANAYRDFDTLVLSEFAKMIRVDDKAIKELKNNRILKELLEDLNRLNTWLESGNLTVDETVKVTAAKDAKLKMLGSFKGMWKGDQLNKGTEEPVEDIHARLQRRYDASNN